MTNLDDLLRRAKSWPDQAKAELAQLGLEIEADLKDGSYRPSPGELDGIDRGLRDVDAGRFVSEAEIEATFAKYRK